MKYVKIGWHAYQIADNFIVQTIITGFMINCDLYSLNESGKLYVSKYYAWDGPTGAFPSKSFIKGSCIHDIFCEMINNGHLPMSVQYLADEQMRQINDSGSMWQPRVIWTYLMVRLHMMCKKKRSPRKIYTI